MATMLETIGAPSVDSFFSGIDASHRLKELLSIPKGISEPELLADLTKLAVKNHDCDELTCFLGGGAYDHFIPTVIDYLVGQSEFLTAYTPYQAEASQGSLQAFYEFQTMICMLTGMEVANASLYEGATAVAEAVMMAGTITGKRRVLIVKTAHPDTRQTLATYSMDLPLEVVEVETADGVTDLSELKIKLNNDTAAVVVQSPNFFGAIERLDEITPLVHESGGLVIASVDPISCGLLANPGSFDVDIVVGEGQPLGIPMAYGAPYCGFLACRREYLRKIPGRVVGQGLDQDGQRGFCLALQTREQHIKRERATSNVCTNQGLFALRAAMYMSAMGKKGLSQVASMCLDKSHYAAGEITKLDGYTMRFDAPFFKEFVIQSSRDVGEVLAHCRSKGILAGLPLGRWYDKLKNCFLVAVTEKRTREEIDALVDALNTA